MYKQSFVALTVIVFLIVSDISTARNNYSSDESQPDTIRFYLPDTSQIIDAGKKCGDCVIELMDSTVVSKTFFVRDGIIQKYIVNDYAGLHHRLFSQIIYENDILIEKRTAIWGDTAWVSKFFYPDGSVAREGHFKFGSPDGTWKEYEAGNVCRILTYKGGMKNGVYKEFHPNGKPKVDGYYQQDKKNNIWKEYGLSRKDNGEKKYIDDELIWDSKNTTLDERTMAVKRKYGLAAADSNCCIIIIDKAKNKPMKKLVSGDRVSIRGKDGNIFERNLVAVKDSCIYTAEVNFLKIITDIHQTKLADIVEIGYTKIKSTMSVSGQSSVPYKEYILFELTDTQYEIRILEKCSSKNH